MIREHARAFFDALFPTVGTEWLAEFRLIPHDRRAREIVPLWCWGSREHVIGQMLEVNAAGYHAYLGINPRRVMGSGKWSNIAAVTALPLDLDHRKTGVSPGAVQRVMTEWGIPPSIVVDSGNGGHLYLLLDQPYDVEEAGTVADFVCRVFRSDNVDDPVRIMRIPGTVNWKEPPSWCYLRELNNRRYSLDEITRAIDAHVPPELSSSSLKKLEILEPPTGETPSAPLEAIVDRLPFELRRIVTHAEMPLWSDDRSEVQWAICHALFNLGATYAQVVEAFEVYALGHLKGNATAAQIERTVNRAYSHYMAEVRRRHAPLKLLDLGYWYYEDGRMVCDKEKLRSRLEVAVRAEHR